MAVPDGVNLSQIIRGDEVSYKPLTLDEAIKLLGAPVSDGNEVKVELEGFDGHVVAERSDDLVWSASRSTDYKECYLPKSPLGVLDRAYRMLTQAKDGRDPMYGPERWK